MIDEQTPIPPLSAYVNASFEELVPVLERIAAAVGDRGRVDAAGGLVLHRALRLLRDGSRAEILKEGLALDGFLGSAAGEAVKAAQPDLYWGWAGLSALLGEAARRSDRAAVESILRSHDGRGRAVLELLAERGAPVRRGELRERLGLSESHLSHVLRDLEEADLIERMQAGREVVIELGPVGRDVAQRALLPEWVSHLAGVLQRARMGAAGERPTVEALADELSKRGAPSRLVAQRLAEAVSGGGGWTPAAAANARRLIEAQTDPQVRPSSAPKITLFSPHRPAA
jgi:DNA-binding transcriptional ArsR family regulator